MNVDDMIADIVSKEGEFVNNPADKGGPTKFGITQATLSRYLQRAATVQEVKDLDLDTVRHIYALNYYHKPRIDRLPEAIQHFVFDCAVNHGPKRAIKFVQNICNQTGFSNLAVDGLMGPKTKVAADTCYAAMKSWMLLALIEERRNFYQSIVAHDPGQKIFLKGWLNRANSFMDEVA